MNEIGKSLVFYLKYFPEMQQAFEDRIRFPNIDPAKVDKVGKAASVEAFNLITACTGDWLKQLERSKVANFKPSRDETVRKNWALEINVRPRNQKASAPLKHQIGVYLDRYYLIPWIWSRGGVAIEEKIKALLPVGTVSSGSKKHGWSGGSIALSPIKIPWDSAEDFSLDADGIIHETKMVLGTISPKFVEALLKL